MSLASQRVVNPKLADLSSIGRRDIRAVSGERMAHKQAVLFAVSGTAPPFAVQPIVEGHSPLWLLALCL